MGSLAYRVRRYRLPLLVAVFFMLFLVQFQRIHTVRREHLAVGDDGANEHVHDDDASSTSISTSTSASANKEQKPVFEALLEEAVRGVIKQDEERKHPPAVIPQVVQHLTQAEETGEGIRWPVDGAATNAGTTRPDPPKLIGGQDPKAPRPGIPNLRANNKVTEQEYDWRKYEILTSGGGSSRVKKDSSKTLPPVNLPRKEKFPVKQTIPLPPPGSLKLGKVQADIQETEQQTRIRLARRDEVRKVMNTSWYQYREHAWGWDEVLPVSLGKSDPFLGWSATMVDALDTLKIMGFDQEYDEAVEFVGNINFKTTFRADIPLFETVIRYLGGLISAFDLSEGKDTILLTKAEELAENLLGAFDTPNRLPLTFFKWQDEDTEKKFRGGTDSVFSEIASMTVEFTRLAQLTKKDKYYDAVARITDAIYEWAPQTGIPWLYPSIADVSGCTPIFDDSATFVQLPPKSIAADLKQSPGQISQPPPQYSSPDVHSKRDVSSLESVDNRQPILIPAGAVNFRRGFCEPKGMRHGSHGYSQEFAFGGLVDSAYEYFMKEFQLLRSGEPKYVELYEKMVDQARANVIFRPKVPNNDDILFIGKKRLTSSGTLNNDYEMQHLTCFAGGMFALGGKLLNRPEDVELGAAITQGCVWAYNSTRNGVMPESFHVEACPGSIDDKACVYDIEPAPLATPVYSGASTTGNLGPPPGYQPGTDPKAGMVRQKRQFSSRPTIARVPDKNGGTRWPVRGNYDQPEGMTEMNPNYNMRPEAIESVFYMYRITGDPKWQEHGWRMFESVRKMTGVKGKNMEIIGYSGVRDVTNDEYYSFTDTVESFWMAETLKYAYLLFDDPEHISLDDYVFNTEAHPFRLS